ncbi:MAG: DNA-3-methyladenine glycosylase I [Alphaproteobacteria bacterium]|nr:DNA-3-methyladenine glycosylase I [Alphaproteobacteria bacterium]
MHRCFWVDLKDEEYIRYHDTEWGIPVHDDRTLFEMLVLESFQAGLSWQCVLHKRNAFRQAFDNFDVGKVAAYSPKKIGELVQNSALIRHRKKMESSVQNARVFIKIQQGFGSFNHYLWHWTNGKVLKMDGTKTQSPLAEQISKDLKKRGMTFVGATTIHAYLCAIGVFNAHTPDCAFAH